MQLPLFDAVEIPLTKGYATFVDSCDADLAGFKWHVEEANDYRKTSYALRRDNRILTRIHRIIMARILGRSLLRSEQVDHIDGDGLNNRRNNLRLATDAQNKRNRGKQTNNTSGYKGVSWHKQGRKWEAHIHADHHKQHLGLFSTPEEAYAAYCKAAIEIHGEFARTK